MYIFYKMESLTSKYLICMHSAVLSMLGADIMPRSILQTIVASMGVFFGAVINANLFGELAVIMSNIGHHEKVFQKKYSSANTVMIQLKLPESTRRLIRDSLIRNEPSLETQIELR